MTANEVPERIWIDLATDLPKLSGYIDKDSVEYIRTDAFIEKACEWLEDNLLDYWGQKNAAPDGFIEDFRNYLKGE